MNNKFKNIIKITIIVVIMGGIIIGKKIIDFDYSSMKDSTSPVIQSSDKFSKAQKILEKHNYKLKSVYDNEEAQKNMPDLKTYTYEGKNGIITIFTDGVYISNINYYE